MEDYFKQNMSIRQFKNNLDVNISKDGLRSKVDLVRGQVANHTNQRRKERVSGWYRLLKLLLA